MFSKESLEFVYVLKERGGGQEQSPESLRAGHGSDVAEEERMDGWMVGKKNTSKQHSPPCFCSSAPAPQLSSQALCNRAGTAADSMVRPSRDPPPRCVIPEFRRAHRVTQTSCRQTPYPQALGSTAASFPGTGDPGLASQ